MRKEPKYKVGDIVVYFDLCGSGGAKAAIVKEVRQQSDTHIVYVLKYGVHDCPKYESHGKDAEAHLWEDLIKDSGIGAVNKLINDLAQSNQLNKEHTEMFQGLFHSRHE